MTSVRSGMPATHPEQQRTEPLAQVNKDPSEGFW
jgi:hypothetical protein